MRWENCLNQNFYLDDQRNAFTQVFYDQSYHTRVRYGRPLRR